MAAHNVRLATLDDVDDIFRVRTSVAENHRSEEDLARRGVTHESVADLLRSESARAWCTDHDGMMVGFSMARRRERDVFALFVLPQFERRGIGSALLDAAVSWLRLSGDDPIRLSTGAGTRALSFYRTRGWIQVDTLEHGDAVLELSRLASTL